MRQPLRLGDVATPATSLSPAPLPATSGPSAGPGDGTGPARPGGTPALTLARTPSRTPARPRPEAVALAFDPDAVALEWTRVAAGLEAPVDLKAAFDGSGRLFIVEKAGTVRVLRRGALVAQPFLDIRERVASSGSEQGLLGLAFHPDFRHQGPDGRLFLNYTDKEGDTRVVELGLAADGGEADPATERLILGQAQPAANHNGGDLAFGPDGYLYIGLGDGGGARDRYRNAQDLGSLLGKLLRLDVDGGEPYALPADNPFLGRPGARPEIWAYGLRNPWRHRFDRETGELYVADVGQGEWEEVNVQAAASRGGENYGWPAYEGRHCAGEAADCAALEAVEPVLEYGHEAGDCAVTGGHVYRGRASPSLAGVYLSGDYCSGRIRGAWRDGSGAWRQAELADTPWSISSFGEGEDGELYVADLGGGAVYRLAARARSRPAATTRPLAR